MRVEGGVERRKERDRGVEEYHRLVTVMEGARTLQPSHLFKLVHYAVQTVSKRAGDASINVKPKILQY